MHINIWSRRLIDQALLYRQYAQDKERRAFGIKLQIYYSLLETFDIDSSLDPRRKMPSKKESKKYYSSSIVSSSYSERPGIATPKEESILLKSNSSFVNFFQAFAVG